MVRYREISTKIGVEEEKERIDNILHTYFNIHSTHPYEINDDGRVSIHGDCSLNETTGKSIRELPIKFDIVSGEFSLYNAPDIISLKGCPIEVGDLHFEGLSITSLDGAPKKIVGSCHILYCMSLTSLIGCPESVGINLTFRGCNNLILDWDTDVACKVGGRISIPYHKDLPLLRTVPPAVLNNSKRVVGYATADSEDQGVVLEIITKYRNLCSDPKNVKKAIYDCQYELIKAGFKGNARW